MQHFANDSGAEVSRNSGHEALVPAEARPAEQPALALITTPLARKGRAPGLAVRTQLKAGHFTAVVNKA
jgi:hypothetical protein